MQFYIINIRPKLIAKSGENYMLHCLLTCRLFQSFSTSLLMPFIVLYPETVL